MHVAVSSDHDDDDGGVARCFTTGVGHWNWFGIETATGNLDHWRTACEPDADALYNSGGLSLPGSFAFLFCFVATTT